MKHLTQTQPLSSAGCGPDDCDILGGPPPNPEPPFAADARSRGYLGARPDPAAGFGAAILHEWTTQGAHEIHFGNGGERSVQPDTLHPFPCTHARGGVVHHKGTPLRLSCRTEPLQVGPMWRLCYEPGKGPCSHCRRYFPWPSYSFPLWRLPDNPARVILQPNPDLDVFYVQHALSPASHDNVVSCLDRLARQRQDFPAPKYHNLIDPNVGAVDGVWVPSDVWVSDAGADAASAASAPHRPELQAVGACQVEQSPGSKPVRPHARLAGLIPDLDPYQHPQVYRAVNDVLTAALPLLAKLTRPALLLPGPLQVRTLHHWCQP